MAEHPNVAIIRQAYEAFAAGDLPTLRSLWTDDVVWHVRGATPLDGDYRGPDEVLGLFGALAQETGGTFGLDVHAILADDDHGVVLVTSHAQRDGRTLSSHDVHVKHLRDGRTSEFWSTTSDPAATLAFWA